MLKKLVNEYLCLLKEFKKYKDIPSVPLIETKTFVFSWNEDIDKELKKRLKECNEKEREYLKLLHQKWGIITRAREIRRKIYSIMDKGRITKMTIELPEGKVVCSLDGPTILFYPEGSDKPEFVDTL
jgi:hypothetical protein